MKVDGSTWIIDTPLTAVYRYSLVNQESTKKLVLESGGIFPYLVISDSLPFLDFSVSFVFTPFSCFLVFPPVFSCFLMVFLVPVFPIFPVFSVFPVSVSRFGIPHSQYFSYIVLPMNALDT